MSESLPHQSQDRIRCPYCGHVRMVKDWHPNGFEMGGEYESSCPKCAAKYIVDVQRVMSMWSPPLTDEALARGDVPRPDATAEAAIAERRRQAEERIAAEENPEIPDLTKGATAVPLGAQVELELPSGDWVRRPAPTVDEVNKDIVDGMLGEGAYERRYGHPWPKDRVIIEGNKLADDQPHSWPTHSLLPEKQPSFRQEHRNIPPGYVELPCSAIVPAAEAYSHELCEVCIQRQAWWDHSAMVEVVGRRVAMLFDSQMPWDSKDSPSHEDVTGIVLELLGTEVLSCAFCGEKYEGEKPVPRAQLATHIRTCSEHPIGKALRLEKREVARLRRRNCDQENRIADLRDELREDRS